MPVKKTQKVRQLATEAVATVVASKAAIDRHRYSTPLFVLRQALSAFDRHNGFGIAASLSFYAMFAMIPMALLIFFLLSHFAVSSSFAITKLTILVSHLVPKYSHRIMIEVYNISRQKAIWGVFGMFGLLWVSTPAGRGVTQCFFHHRRRFRIAHLLAAQCGRCVWRAGYPDFVFPVLIQRLDAGKSDR